MGSAMACQSQEGPRAQDTAEAGRRRVRHVMMLQLPALHEHTGILSLPVRMQVREHVLSLRLRRDVLNFLLVFCTPADVGHLAGIDRSVYEFCEVDCNLEHDACFRFLDFPDARARAAMYQACTDSGWHHVATYTPTER